MRDSHPISSLTKQYIQKIYSISSETHSSIFQCHMKPSRRTLNFQFVFKCAEAG